MFVHNHKPISLGVMLLAAFSVSTTARAEGPSAEEIVEKANLMAYYQGKDGRATVSMTIVDKQGRTQTRKLVIIRKDDESSTAGAQKIYAYFEEPSDVAKTVFMVHKNVDRDDDRWLYVPGLDLVKRIASSDKRTSFVGSDFFYEDVSGRGTKEDDHRLLETTKNYFVMEHTPKDPGSVEFSKYRSHIHRGSFLPTKLEYFDKTGKKYREMQVDAVKKVQGHSTVTKATMKDLASGTHTVIEYSDVRYDIGVPDKIFAERYLRRPPAKYLR